MKSIILILTMFFTLSAKECDTDYINKDGGFYYETKKGKIYNRSEHKWVDTMIDDKTQFYNCNIDTRNLYMYLYRGDMENILLIQFIFKTNNDNFLEFAEEFVETEIIQKAISKIKSDKKIVLEINSNKHFEVRYDIEEGKITSYEISSDSYNK